MNIQLNTKMFHVGQKVCHDFINLRTPWVARIFNGQLFKKMHTYNVSLANYSLLTNHYHLEIVLGDEKAFSNFYMVFNRDLIREIRTYIRTTESEKKYLPFLKKKIFEKKPFIRPIYSARDIWKVFRYIVLNPVKAYDDINTSKEYFLSGANDIAKNVETYLDFDLIRHLLGETSLIKCIEIAELGDKEFENYMDMKFKNWTAKDDELLLRFSESIPWKPQQLLPIEDLSDTKYKESIKQVSLLSKMK